MTQIIMFGINFDQAYADYTAQCQEKERMIAEANNLRDRLIDDMANNVDFAMNTMGLQSKVGKWYDFGLFLAAIKEAVKHFFGFKRPSFDEETKNFTLNFHKLLQDRTTFLSTVKEVTKSTDDLTAVILAKAEFDAVVTRVIVEKTKSYLQSS